MIDLFNHLKYDAWIIGNHEFDWGIEPFTSATKFRDAGAGCEHNVRRKTSRRISDSQHPFAKFSRLSLRRLKASNRNYRNHNAGHVVLASAGIYGWNRFSISR